MRVIMQTDETGYQRFSGKVNMRRPRRHTQRSVRAERGDRLSFYQYGMVQKRSGVLARENGRILKQYCLSVD